MDLAKGTCPRRFPIRNAPYCPASVLSCAELWRYHRQCLFPAFRCENVNQLRTTADVPISHQLNGCVTMIETTHPDNQASKVTGIVLQVCRVEAPW